MSTNSVGSHSCTQNATYQRFTYLYDIATGLHNELLTTIFQLAIVCCEVTGHMFFEYPVPFQPLPLCSILRYEQKCFLWPCNELLWHCLSHKLHLVPPTVTVNSRLYLCSTEPLPTVTQLCTIAMLVLC